MKDKYFVMVTIIISLFFIFPSNVKAGAKSGVDSCVSDHTCMQVCEWENLGYHVYAYYYFSDGSWKYSWYYPYNPFLAERSSSGLPTKNIFYENDSIKSNLSSKGVCPTAAYVDTDGFGTTAELCFDSKKKVSGEKTYCHNASNIGTTFSGSSTLTYQVTDHIAIYFDEHAIPAINEVSCDDLASSNGYTVDVDKLDELLDRVSTDFSHNFLYDNPTPAFIKNGLYATKLETYRSKLKLKGNTCETALKEKAKEDVTNGTLTQEKYNELFNESSNLEEKIDEKVDQLDQDMSEGINAEHPTPSDEQEILEATCENILGEEITKYLKTALTVIQIVGVLLAVVLGMLDFLGAVISGEADANTKAFKKFKIRIAMAAVLLLVPALLKFLLNTFGIVSGGDTFCIL